MRKTSRLALAPWVLGLAAALAVAALAWHDARQPPPADMPPALLDAPLAAAAGTTSLGDLRGRWVLVLFGYMTCPDVCPTALAYLAREMAALGPGRDAVQVVFVSADPERDAPADLDRYVRHFDPAFLGVTGQPASLAAVAKGLGAYYGREPAPDSAAGYLVTHSSSFFLVDPAGRFVKSLPSPHERGAVAAELRRLATLGAH